MPHFDAQTGAPLDDDDLLTEPEVTSSAEPAPASPSTSSSRPTSSSTPMLTLAQAQLRADAIRAAADGVSTHPLNDAGHPAHAETVHEFLRLNGIAAAGTPTAGAALLPELPGMERVDQAATTGAPLDPAADYWPDADYVVTDGLEPDREVQDALRVIGRAFGSAQPEYELLEGLKGLHERQVPVLETRATAGAWKADGLAGNSRTCCSGGTGWRITLAWPSRNSRPR